MKKKIISIVLMALMLLSVFPLSAFASEGSSDVIQHEDLSQTTIASDFERVFPIGTDITKYKENKTLKEFSYINLMETFIDEQNSSVYLYVYNPSRKVVFRESEKHTVSISYGYESNFIEGDFLDYAYKHMTLIDVYDDTLENSTYTNGLILKFKIDDVSLQIQLDSRHYKLADVELLEKDQTQAGYFVAGRHVEFFEDKNGYTNSTTRDLSVLELEAFHTYYRCKTESTDIYEDIQSVYFAIPNSLKEAYGGVYSMKLNYKVNSYCPILVANNSSVVDQFNSRYIKGHGACDYALFFSKYTHPFANFVAEVWGTAYNTEAVSQYKNKALSTLIANAIMSDVNSSAYSFPNIMEMPIMPDVYVGDENHVFGELALAIYNESIEIERPVIMGEKLINELLSLSFTNPASVASTKTVADKIITVQDEGQTVTKYKICNGWQAWWGGGYYNKAGDSVSIEPFQEIDLQDLKKYDRESFSDKYLIDSNDVSCGANCEACFTCISSKEEYANHTWYILHYEKTPFASMDAAVVNGENGEYDFCDSCVFMTSAIHDFDVITVGLTDTPEDTTTVTVFPVGRSKTDFTSDVTAPTKVPEVSLDDFWSTFGDKIENLLKIVLIILLAIAIFIVAIKILPPVIRLFDRGNKNNRKDDKE